MDTRLDGRLAARASCSQSSAGFQSAVSQGFQPAGPPRFLAPHAVKSPADWKSATSPECFRGTQVGNLRYEVAAGTTNCTGAVLKLLQALLATAVLSTSLLRAALPVPDPDDGAITLQPGFRALVVADNLNSDRSTGRRTDVLRFLTVAPNGDIYAKYHRSGLVALRDTNSDGRADVIEKFGSGPGTCVAVHDDWLYYSTRTGVYRYKYTAGELVPKGELETIVSGLPADRDHDAKCFAFDEEGRMLVEVGSPYNVYSKPDRQFGAKGMDATEFLQTHGGFWRFDPNKTNQTQADGFHFSTGHRHSLAVVWHPVSKQFFNIMMGRDNLSLVDPDHYDDLDSAERVAEEMHLLREGANLGWPYTYWDPIKKARMVAP